MSRSAAGERIKLTRYNKTAAILISKRDLERLQDCEKATSRRKRAGGASD